MTPAHMMIATGLVISGIAALRPRKQDYLAACLSQLQRLKHKRLESIMDFVTEDAAAKADRAFWEQSAGLAGLISRLRDLRPILTIIQASVALKHITDAEARHLRVLSAAQFWYSLLALPEAILCTVTPYPHVMALRAAQRHYSVTALTITLCPVERLFGPNALL